MKTISEARQELNNIWHDLYFADGNVVQILNGGDVVAEAEMENIDDDSEIVEFVDSFING